MFAGLVMPLIGSFVLLGWMVPVAWALRPASTRPAEAAGSLAEAKVARALTRNGLLAVPLTALTAFLVTRLLFDLPGWFQLTWVAGILLTGYAMWRCAMLWPTPEREQRLRRAVAAHGMRPAGLPWAMIIAPAVALAVWFVPPLFF